MNFRIENDTFRNRAVEFPPPKAFWGHEFSTELSVFQYAVSMSYSDSAEMSKCQRDSLF